MQVTIAVSVAIANRRTSIVRARPETDAAKIARKVPIRSQILPTSIRRLQAAILASRVFPLGKFITQVQSLQLRNLGFFANCNQLSNCILCALLCRYALREDHRRHLWPELTGKPSHAGFLKALQASSFLCGIRPIRISITAFLRSDVGRFGFGAFLCLVGCCHGLQVYSK